MAKKTIISFTAIGAGYGFLRGLGSVDLFPIPEIVTWAFYGFLVGWFFSNTVKAISEREGIWSTITLLGLLIGIWRFRTISQSPFFFDAEDALLLWPCVGWVVGLIVHLIVKNVSENDNSNPDHKRYERHTEYSQQAVGSILQAIKNGELIFANGRATEWNGVSSPGFVTLGFINAKGEQRWEHVYPLSIRYVDGFIRLNRPNRTELRLNPTRIQNPELLGFDKLEPVNTPRRVEPADKRTQHAIAPGEDDCPRCNNSHVRLWDGGYRCWNCGYTFDGTETQPMPPVIEKAETDLPEPPEPDFGLPPLPPPEPFVPEPVTQFQTGTRIAFDQLPLDTYEAVQVMRRLKPELSPFEIHEAFDTDANRLLQGYNAEQAEAIAEELRAADCTVSLVNVEEGEQPKPVVPEPPTVITEQRRAPTEEEFHEIRFGLDGDRITRLITSGMLDLTAVDAQGSPVLHGCMNPHIVNLLISYGANPSQTDTTGNTPLHRCVDQQVIEELAEADANLNAFNHKGDTALHTWAAEGLVTPVMALLVHGADASLRNRQNQSPLETAREAPKDANSKNRDHAGVIELLESWEGHEHSDSDQMRPPTEEEFHEIRMGTDRHRVMGLITGGQLDLNACDAHGYPLLHGVQIARIAGMLIEHGAAADALDNDRNTALHYCDDSAVQEVLIENGVPVNTVNRAGDTALHLWAARGALEPVKTLLYFKADPTIRNLAGQNALLAAQDAQESGATGDFDEVITQIANHMPSHEDALPPVIEEELPPVIENAKSDGRAPTDDETITIQFSRSADEVTKLVVERNLNVNAHDKHGKPLLFEVYHAEAAKALIQLGADVNAIDEFGQTPLINNHRVKVCEVLIRYGADLNRVSRIGGTALNSAAGMGDFDKAKLLIDHGADINLAAEYDNTPLQEAMNSHWDMNNPDERENAIGCQKIAELLRSLGAK